MTLDTHHPIDKFMSSQKMESLETREKVITLGKKLAKHFEDYDNGDAISQWMAHYIAEQIAKVESSKGKAKKQAEKKCFETILKLWHHQSYYPRGSRPFENFESVFRAISSLDPENQYAYYYSEQDKGKPSLSENAEIWLNVAKVIDQTAKVLIRYSIEQGIKSSFDKESIDWLTTILDIDDSNELKIFKIVVPGLDTIHDQETAAKEQEREIERLKNRIEQLDDFIEISKFLKNDLSKQLEAIENE